MKHIISDSSRRLHDGDSLSLSSSSDAAQWGVSPTTNAVRHLRPSDVEHNATRDSQNTSRMFTALPSLWCGNSFCFIVLLVWRYWNGRVARRP